MNKQNNNQENLNDKLDNFVNGENQEDCTGEQCLIKSSKGLVERVNKKLVTEDGRELLL